MRGNFGTCGFDYRSFASDFSLRRQDGARIPIDMTIRDRVLGKPLATSEERAEHIGVAAGYPDLWAGCADFGGLRA